MTAPFEDGESTRNYMCLALEDAGLEPRFVDDTDTEGTSTPAGHIAGTPASKMHSAIMPRDRRLTLPVVLSR